MKIKNKIWIIAGLVFLISTSIFLVYTNNSRNSKEENILLENILSENILSENILSEDIVVKATENNIDEDKKQEVEKKSEEIISVEKIVEPVKDEKVQSEVINDSNYENTVEVSTEKPKNEENILQSVNPSPQPIVKPETEKPKVDQNKPIGLPTSASGVLVTNYDNIAVYKNASDRSLHAYMWSEGQWWEIGVCNY